MSKKFWNTPALKLKPLFSPVLLRFWVVLFALSWLLIGVLPIHFATAAAALLAVLLVAINNVWRGNARFYTAAVDALQYRNGSWSLLLRDGECVSLGYPKGAVISRTVIAASFPVSQGRFYQLVLSAGCIDAESWRRLVLALRFGPR